MRSDFPRKCHIYIECVQGVHITVDLKVDSLSWAQRVLASLWTLHQAEIKPESCLLKVQSRRLAQHYSKPRRVSLARIFLMPNESNPPSVPYSWRDSSEDCTAQFDPEVKASALFHQHIAFPAKMRNLCLGPEGVQLCTSPQRWGEQRQEDC